MKLTFKIFAISIFTASTFAQNATEIDPKFVKLARYTDLAAITAALSTPVKGMMVYNEATGSNWLFNGTDWVNTSIVVPSSGWTNGPTDIYPENLEKNVSVGTNTPQGNLHVNSKNTNWNFPTMLLTDNATNNEGGAIFQFRNLADKRMDLQSHFGTLPNGSDSYMTFSHSANYHMRLRGDGNLGVGSLNPNLAGLVVDKKVGNANAMFGSNTAGVSIESNFPGIHFNSYYNGSRKTISTGYTSGAEMNPSTGDFSIYTSSNSTTKDGTSAVYTRLNIDKNGIVGIPNILEIGHGLTKQIDNGKIALNQFGEANSLSIVGGGTAADGSDRRIKFFANAESDFSGPIKFVGPLKPAGNAGISGQVLTSTGTSSTPTWQNTAPAPYSNNTRFMLAFNGPGNVPYSAFTFLSTIYNTNTNNITIGANSITISKAGLYHFDVQIGTSVPWAGCGTCHYPSLNVSLDSPSLQYTVISDQVLQPYFDNRTYNWKYNDIKNFDIYIAAPTTFSLNFLFSDPGTISLPHYTSGKFSGHLISE